MPSPYRVVEDLRVQRRTRRLYVRDRARYEDAKRLLREQPYPPSDDLKRRRLDFDDGLSIFSLTVASFPYMIIYIVRDPVELEDVGTVRIIALIDRTAESRRS